MGVSEVEAAPYVHVTDRQRDVLRFMRSHQTMFGFPPSVREICDELGVTSTATAYAHLTGLVAAGKIERRTNGHRTVFVLKDAS